MYVGEDKDLFSSGGEEDLYCEASLLFWIEHKEKKKKKMEKNMSKFV